MKYYYCYFFLLFFSACYNKIKEVPPHDANQIISVAFDTIDTEAYELIKPLGEQKGVLILFPGFPETPTKVKQEFKIVQPALKKGIALVLMKFNQRLWLDTQEKFRLASTFNQLIINNDLDSTNIFIGGFSSGGNISLLLANHLAQTENLLQPKGVFIIDSPVDLLGLYEISKRNIQRDFSAISMQESKRTVNRFDISLGKPEAGIENYEAYAPYTHKTNNIQNLAHLNNIKIRLYTEPDSQWWQENRQNEWEDMNAFSIQHLATTLTKKYGDNVEYIATENRGYRANGQRHPHSWAIVEIKELLKWITNE